MQMFALGALVGRRLGRPARLGLPMTNTTEGWTAWWWRRSTLIGTGRSRADSGRLRRRAAARASSPSARHAGLRAGPPNGIKPFYGPFGDFSDPVACEAQFRNAFLLGCAGAWTLHASQIAIAKRVFSPDPAEVAFAHKILTAMPDGSGAVMIDGKMQDDATWKQAKVIVELAKQVAAKDAEYAAIYRF